MSDMMTQEEAVNMSNEQAVQILIPMRNMMCDQHGCPISDAVFALDKAIEILSADRQQEWIPCSERLPELTIHENEPFIGEWDNSEPVLIYHKDNKYEYPYLIAQYTNGFENNEVGWTEMEEANDVIDVVAWMPLPEPWRDNEQ